MDMDNEDIASRYRLVSEQVKATALRCRRSINSVRIVAVSKKQPVRAILEAIQAGAANFGENYPEEAVEKIQAILDKNIQWHMIGHVQSRKAGIVANYFDTIHSIDSLVIAQKLNNHLQNTNNKRIPVLLEVNIGSEESKTGFEVESYEQKEQFIKDVDQIILLSNLNLNGLMVMPPFTSIPEESRKYFNHAHKLLDELQERFPSLELKELSMGTSVDYLVAIEEGATLVRVGTAIFGKRG
jgi:PLP dependent protein